MLRVIAVANQKGGVGKTTTAVNLSACVAAEGRRVLLIDMDPQGNASSGLGIDKSAGHASVYESIIEGAPLGLAIKETPVPNLCIVPSAMRLAGAEVELVSEAKREHRLRAAIEQLGAQFDFILIDCPPSLGFLTLNALTAADALLVPIQCEYYALEGLTQLMNTVRLVRQRMNPHLDIEGVVLTMFDGRTNLGAQVISEVKKYFQGKVHTSVIPRNVRLSEAPSHGMPIHQYDPRSTGAMAYRDLASEFLLWNSAEGGCA